MSQILWEAVGRALSWVAAYVVVYLPVSWVLRHDVIYLTWELM